MSRCVQCGHRVAAHALGDTGVDYHRQYGPAFLESLARTRRRQAEQILDRIRAIVPDANDLLDYGAGRGWFLDACRAAGMTRVAGADTSADAVAGLSARGISAVVLPVEGAPDAALAAIPFRPRIVSLLDVVEHFTVSDLREIVSQLVSALRPDLELVVIKVPLADGLMYRVSRGLATAGLAGPIEQLYQVGTFPPHRSYFSRSSMRSLLERTELEGVDEMGLVEVDRDVIGDRVAALRRLPGPASAIAGRMIGVLAAAGPGDAGLFIARPILRTL